MIKKVSILLLCVAGAYAEDAIEQTAFEQFEQTVNSKIHLLENKHVASTTHFQQLMELANKHDSLINNLQTTFAAITASRNQSASDIQALKDNCKQLELSLENQKGEAKYYALAGAAATALGVLAYQAWLYRNKMGAKTTPASK